MNGKERLSASVDADLIRAAEQSVRRGDYASMSAWVNDALRLKLEHERRMVALANCVAHYEAAHGEITRAEMDAAQRSARARALVVRGADAAATERIVALVLDAGALVALERGDRETIALLKRELGANRVPLTHGGVVGQVWRSGVGRLANLARLLPALEIAPLDESLGRRAGSLPGRARTTDVIDAALVLLASDDDMVLTSDPEDLERLAIRAGSHLDIVRV